MSDNTGQEQVWQQKPSPMRILRAWLFRERAVRGPAAIELDVVERQVDRESAAVSAAAGAAAGIERRIDGAKTSLRAALADGVVDASEARALARSLVRTSLAAHEHTCRLEALR